MWSRSVRRAFMKIDLHIHSKYSGDAFNEPRDIIKQAKKAGLDGVAVTDHNTIKGGEETARCNSDEDFIVITGAEIKTDRGEVIGYFLNEEIESRSFEEVIDAMRDQDALISIPHPYDLFRSNRIKDPEKAAGSVDAVEVFNSRCLLSSFNGQALSLSERFSLGATAGSDAHSPEEIGSAGVIIKGERVHEEILRNREYFGRKNPALLHAKTTLQRLLP
ncbi:MAG: PHP domain-containing protein [Methanobacteriota archaeon]|nr:MAG: PHP domain-containing protein [Euryarchaeota archaeon]